MIAAITDPLKRDDARHCWLFCSSFRGQRAALEPGIQVFRRKKISGSSPSRPAMTRNDG